MTFNKTTDFTCWFIFRWSNNLISSKNMKWNETETKSASETEGDLQCDNLHWISPVWKKLNKATRYKYFSYILEYLPNSSLTGCQEILSLDMLGFSYCIIVCQDLIKTENSNETDLANTEFFRMFLGNFWAFLLSFSFTDFTK